MLDQILGNIRTFYTHTFWQMPEAVTEYGTGYVLSFSGNTWMSGANQLWLDDPAQLDVYLLDHAVRFFRQHLAEWSIFVLPEAQADLKTRCLRHGGFVRWTNPVMLLEGQPAIPFDVSHIPVERAQSELAYRQGKMILGEAFHMESSDHVMRPEHDSQLIRHYLARYRGHPAAAATLIYSPSIAGIWNVGTRRLYRRRGLAHALMQRMCQDALADGYAVSALLASSQGRHLYQQMGYTTLAEAYYIGMSLY